MAEQLPEINQRWGQKVGLKNVELDSFIISATPYDELRDYYGDDNWIKKQFANKHILFFEVTSFYDYLYELLNT